jgi:glyoxylase I family protein
MTKPLSRLPMRLHHNAFTTDDHEENRRFYEDILGIPLKAMYVERELLNDEFVEFGYAFYELEDGSSLAFFNFADQQKQASWKAKEQSLFIHIALLVTKSTQEEIERRLVAADIKPFVLEHGCCTSLYVKDPNGLMLEFTVDHQDAGDIAREMATTAHQDMQRWIRGDRTPNNRWRADVQP